MGLRSKSGLLAWAALLLAAGLMLACFAAGERAAEPLAALPAPETAAGRGHPEQAGQVNVNTASEEELTALPGIGAAKAAAIVAYRAEHGPFRYPEELIRVNGIGEGILNNLLEQITVGGGAYAEDLSGGR